MIKFGFCAAWAFTAVTDNGAALGMAPVAARGAGVGFGMCFLTGCLAKAPTGANNTAHSDNLRNTLSGYAMVDRIPQKIGRSKRPSLYQPIPIGRKTSGFRLFL
jgi:hypothetical protein